MHPGLAVLATAYLPITLMLLTFAAELMLEGLLRNRAMWLVNAAFLAALAGAVVRALVQSAELHSGWHTTSTALLVVAVVLLCAAVTHHDSRRILERRGAAQATSPHHETILMAPLIVSLAVPIVLVATTSPSTNVDIAVRGLVMLVLVVATIARLYVALDANSRAQQALVRRLDRDELTNLPTRSRFLSVVGFLLV
jgi:hypothetical protein